MSSRFRWRVAAVAAACVLGATACAKDNARAGEVEISVSFGAELPADRERAPLDVDYLGSLDGRVGPRPTGPDVRAALETHEGALGACLEGESSAVLYLRLRPDGTWVPATVPATGSERCIADAVASTRFPPFEPPAEILKLTVRTAR